jgi:hypothetical protein
MIRTQVMKSVIKQVFRFSGRLLCFMLIIASIFNFGQSLSTENSGYIHFQDDILITNNIESKEEVAVRGKEISPDVTVSGEEYIYVADGTFLYGIDKKTVNKIAKKHEDGYSLRKKYAAANKPVRKKAVNNNTEPAQCIISYPERDPASFISVSGQVFFAVPGSHYQNFILHQPIRCISAGKAGEYIFQNYHYLFSVFSKITISDGGIRPPPFHC